MSILGAEWEWPAPVRCAQAGSPEPSGTSLTCADTCEQAACTPAPCSHPSAHPMRTSVPDQVVSRRSRAAVVQPWLAMVKAEASPCRARLWAGGSQQWGCAGGRGMGVARPVNSRDAVMGDLWGMCLWPGGKRALPLCRVVLPCRAGICLLDRGRPGNSSILSRLRPSIVLDEDRLFRRPGSEAVRRG